MPDPAPAVSLRKQWTSPTDIFSILLILGGDVVQLALTSLTGGGFTPLTFSFGWVAYSTSAVLGAVGENRLVQCAPEISLLVINLESGYARANRSWVLARLLKTYEYWMPAEVRQKRENYLAFRRRLPDQESDIPPALVDGAPYRPGLCVAVYDFSPVIPSGIPQRDWLWWSGLLFTAGQLGIASIPVGIWGDWTIILLTAAGNVLTYASASLPQWRRDKWAARRQDPSKEMKAVAVTTGNGSRQVIIIRSRGGSVDLEDLATSAAPEKGRFTRAATLVLAVLWLGFLLTATGIEENTWYLLAVGGLGMLHNLVVAGAPRKPPCLGLPIELAKVERDGVKDPLVFGEMKVMWTLMELEMAFKGYGKSLLEEFFPGPIMEWEKNWWSETDPAERRKLLAREKEKFHAKLLEKKLAAKEGTTVQVSSATEKRG